MRARSALLLLLILTVASDCLSQQRVLWQSSTGATSSQPTHTVKIDFNQRVSMRDAVELSADVYHPAAQGRFPVILSRTPYNKTGASALTIARYFASRGYVYVPWTRGRAILTASLFPPTMGAMDMTRSNGARNNPVNRARERLAARITGVFNGSLPLSNRRIWRP